MPAESTETAPAQGPVTRSRRWMATLLIVTITIAAGAGIAGWRWYAGQPRNRYVRGRRALDAGDRRTALRESQYLTAIPGFEPQGHLLAGLLLARGGKPADALQELQYAAWDDETALEALTAAAECYYTLGRYQNAAESARAALARDEHATAARRWLASAYYDLGAMAHATRELKRISEEDPADPRSEFLLGLIAKDEEQFRPAIEHFLKALDRGLAGEHRETLLLDLTESLLKLGRYDDALQTLTECQPSPRSLTFESEALQGLQRHKEAYEKVRRAIELDPDFFPARLQEGTLLLFDQHTAEAARALEAAVRLAPHSSRTHFQLSQVYQRLGKTEEAAEQIRLMKVNQALEHEFFELNTTAAEKPTDAELRFRIGQLAQQLGKPELAQMWFRAVLALQPDHAGARKELAGSEATPH